MQSTIYSTTVLYDSIDGGTVQCTGESAGVHRADDMAGSTDGS